MESARKAVSFRNVSLPRGVDLDGFKLTDHMRMLRMGLCGLNCCGLFILFISLCILGSKAPASSIGLLWWTLFVHLGVSAAWCFSVFVPGRWSSQLQTLQPFQFMSALLLMLLCDRAVQITTWTTTGTVNGAADGTLAGGIICLLAFLPHLLDERFPHEPEEAHESHRLMTDHEGKPQTHLECRNSQPSDPEMSFVDLSSGLKDVEDERSCVTRKENTSSSGFRAYLNPMNMAAPEEEMQEGSPCRKEDKDEVRIKPALMPQVHGYPKPPPDLPPSPSPAARVCVPTATQPTQKSSLASGARAPSSDGSTTKIPAGPVPPAGPAPPAGSQPPPKPVTPTSLPAPQDPKEPQLGDGVTATMPIPRDLKLADETESIGKTHQPRDETKISQQPPLAPNTFVPPEANQPKPSSVLNPVASSQGFKSSSLSEYSMVVHGAGPSHGVATVESKATNNANDVGVTFPKLPVLASNPLAEPDELDKFESPKGTLPTQVYPTLTTVHPGIGLKSAAFLNQGDSEDSDEEFNF